MNAQPGQPRKVLIDLTDVTSAEAYQAVAGVVDMLVTELGVTIDEHDLLDLAVEELTDGIGNCTIGVAIKGHGLEVEVPTASFDRTLNSAVAVHEAFPEVKRHDTTTTLSLQTEPKSATE